MTVTVNLSPDVEQAYLAQAEAKRVAVEDLVRDILVAMKPSLTARKTVFEQGLGLFGSPEDAALLDEVVAIAYEERHPTGTSSLR